MLIIDGQLFDDPQGYDDNRAGSGETGFHKAIEYVTEENVKCLYFEGNNSETILESLTTSKFFRS